MTKAGGSPGMRPRPASDRPTAAAAGGEGGGPVTAAQRSQALRMNLFVLVRILFQYLERVDRSILDLAKEVLKDCERKHNTKDSKYETLADAISERVRDAVGETHWAKARQIQKQLAANQQRKKMRAMQQARKRSSTKAATAAASAGGASSASDLGSRLGAQRSSEDAMEAARAMSALSQQSTTSSAKSSNSNNLVSASKSLDQEMEVEEEEGDNSTSRDHVPLKSKEPPSAGQPSIDGEAGKPSASSSPGGHLPLRKRKPGITFPPSSFNPNAASPGSNNPNFSGSNFPGS